MTATATASLRSVNRKTAGKGLEPRERPILFKAEMVRAILAGRKTQTRRIAKGGRVVGGNLPYFDNLTEKLMNGDDTEVSCPYGVVGERLWVKETWYCDHCFAGDFNLTSGTYVDRTLTHEECIAEWRGLPEPHITPGHMMYYRADGKASRQFEQLELPFRWSSSLFMPRWASRLVLEITEVRVQHLQDITAEDALAEGIARNSKDGGRTWKYGIPDADGWPGTDDVGWPWHEWQLDPVDAFEVLWNRVNGADGPKSWAANPWVWALSFRKVAP